VVAERIREHVGNECGDEAVAERHADTEPDGDVVRSDPALGNLRRVRVHVRAHSTADVTAG